MIFCKAHSVVSSGIKAIWTVDKECQKRFVSTNESTHALLIVYIGKCQTQIVYVSNNTCILTVRQFVSDEKEIYKVLKGNSRGIEYSAQFFHKLVESSDLHVSLHYSHTNKTATCPIQNRMTLIKNLKNDGQVDTEPSELLDTKVMEEQHFQ